MKNFLWLLVTAVLCCCVPDQPADRFGDGGKNDPAVTAVSDPATLLPKIRAALSGYVCEVHYLSISGMNSLSIWLMEPALDPNAKTSEEIRAGSATAVRTGLAVLRRVTESVPGVRETFEGYNPMIVDRECNAWYIDLLPMEEAAGLAGERLTEKTDDVARRNLRDRAATGEGAPEANEYYVGFFTERWTILRTGIAEVLGERQSGGNTGAYIIRDKGRALLQVFTDSRGGEESSQGLIVRVLGLLSDAEVPLDDCEFHFVSESGLNQYYSTVSGDALAGWRQRPLTENEIVIRPLGR